MTKPISVNSESCSQVDLYSPAVSPIIRSRPTKLSVLKGEPQVINGAAITAQSMVCHPTPVIEERQFLLVFSLGRLGVRLCLHFSCFSGCLPLNDDCLGIVDLCACLRRDQAGE